MSENQQLSRDNHFFSQSYLKNWETEDGIHEYSLLVSDEKVPLWTCKSRKGIAVVKNLYVRIEDGKEMDDFEHFFDVQFESPAEKPISKVINGERLSKDEWYTLIEYVAAQYVRTPVFHQWTHKIRFNLNFCV